MHYLYPTFDNLTNNLIIVHQLQIGLRNPPCLKPFMAEKILGLYYIGLHTPYDIKANQYTNYTSYYILLLYINQ